MLLHAGDLGVPRRNKSTGTRQHCIDEQHAKDRQAKLVKERAPLAANDLVGRERRAQNQFQRAVAPVFDESPARLERDPDLEQALQPEYGPDEIPR